ncbi:isochorismatase family protein [Cytobacillus kochii]|uniref:isochorismatase family protein n=1 Tax=Cytobacillus kochii TaxID=859143 RepID=UPI00402AEE91
MSIPKIKTYPLPEANSLPKNKVDWQLDNKRAVLLIHDMQNYFINYYENGSQLIEGVIEKIARVKAYCQSQNIPIVYTAQPGNQKDEDRALLTDFWGPGLTEDEAQTGIVPELAPTDNDTIQTKWRYSAFKKSNLLDRMKEDGRDQLIICGVYAHIGCLATAMEAFMYDIQPFLIADAVADFSYEEHVHALNYTATRCGKVLLTEAILHDLSEKNASNRTHSEIKTKVAEILDISPSEIKDDDDLVSLGLDSIRMMTLVEEWRAEGADVNFMKMASNPTLQAWYEMFPQTDEVYS